MKTEYIQALAASAAKNIKSDQDFQDFKKMLTKMMLETALNTELDEHLGYDMHEITRSDNSSAFFERLLTANSGHSTPRLPARTELHVLR